MRRPALLPLLFLLFVLTLVFTTHAQPAESWLRTYDYGGNDSYRAVTPTPDGGQALLTLRVGELLLVKLDRYGAPEWEHATPEISVDFPMAGSLLRTPDGGFSYRYDDDGNRPLVHVDVFGREQWRVQHNDLGLEMVARENGGYVIATATTSPSRLKLSFLDANGMIQSETLFDPPGGQLGVGGIQQDTDGNLYVFCIQSSVPSEQALVYKVNGQGNLLWLNDIPGFDRPAVQCFGGFVTGDGGCVWYGAGYQQIAMYQFDWAALAARLPADGGDAIWTASFEEDLLGTDDERFVIGVEGANGTCYLAGDLAGTPAVLSVDMNGNELWRYLGPSDGVWPQYYYFGATFEPAEDAVRLFGMDSVMQDALQQVFGAEEPAPRPFVEFDPTGSLVFPPAGGILTSDITLENPTGETRQLRARRSAFGPNGTERVLDNVQLTLAPGEAVTIWDYEQIVPAGIPGGEYVHRLLLLDGNGQKLSSRAYTFVKEGAGVASGR